MRVLVTGASGLLGHHIVEELLKRNTHVRLLLRNPNGNLWKDSPLVEMASGNIEDREAVNAAVEGCTHIIHAAANTKPWPVALKHYLATNVEGTKHICHAALQFGIKRMVYVSTAGFIGPGTTEHPATEQDDFRPIHTLSGYVTSKYLAQQFVLEQARVNGLPALVVNPTFLIGANDRKPSSGKMLLYGLKRKLVLCPSGVKDFVPARDVATATCNALTMGETGTFYILSGYPMRYSDFFMKLKQIYGRPILTLTLPKWLFMMAGAIGNMLQFLLQKPIPLNLTNARILCSKNYYNAGKAKHDLAFSPGPLEDAISECVRWLRQNGYI